MIRTTTEDTAKYWAKTGTEILLTDPKVFDDTVSKEKLESNLYQQILKNLVDHDTSDISEEQLARCIEQSKN